MANAFVLIVEDDATNSDLVRGSLSPQGIDVRTASSAEQALQIFEELRPRLVLIDISLSGADGLELVKRLKSDPAKADVSVLALGDFAGNDGEQKALAAGCNGSIAKPIDPSTFPALIQKYLEQPLESPTNPAPSDANPAPSDSSPVPSDNLPVSSSNGVVSSGLMEPDSDPEIRELQQEFIGEAIQQAKLLLGALDTGFNQRTARVAAHRWAGSGGSVGYGQVSQTARELEELLRENGGGSPARVRELLESLDRLFAEAQEKLSRAPATEDGAGQSGDASGVSSAAMVSALAGKRFALSGFEPEEAERLSQTLERSQVIARNLGADAFPDAEAVRPFDVVILNVAHGAHTIPRWNKPLLMIGPRDVLLGLQALHHGTAEFVFSPWTEEDLILRSYFAMARTVHPVGPRGASAKGGERRVLVADDDPTIRALVKAAVQNAGFQCRVAVDGEDAMSIIKSWQPDLAVIDVEMPGKDGFEVLTWMRGDPLSVDIPVILLTACQQDKDVILGFRLGANDYVVKPFMPAELIERVKKLLRKHVRRIWITTSGSGGVLYA